MESPTRDFCCFRGEKKYTNGLKSGWFPRSVGTPLSLIRYICVSKSGFLYNVRLVVYLSRRRGKERFCYSSTLVYISSVFFSWICDKFLVTSRLISCVAVVLFCFCLFFSCTHNPLNGLTTMFQKFRFVPAFILAINSNSIRKNDNIVVLCLLNDTAPSLKRQGWLT